MPDLYILSQRSNHGQYRVRDQKRIKILLGTIKIIWNATRYRLSVDYEAPLEPH